MKITPKPIVSSDNVSKARDMSGLKKWSQESRLVSGVMLFLGWFTIPAEVFMRKDFGERWFTKMNFFAGGMLILIIALIRYLAGVAQYWISQVGAVWNPFYSEQVTSDVMYKGATDTVAGFWLYFIIGCYHLFKIWWRSRTKRDLHSYDDGTSLLEPVGGVIMYIVNGLTSPFIWLYMQRRPVEERQGDLPKLINDKTAFTNTVIDPLLLVVVCQRFPPIEKIWMYITAFAVAIHASRKEAAKKSKILDFKDSQIEARMMSELKEKMQDEERIKEKLNNDPRRRSPKPLPQVMVQYPDLANIIEAMHRERSHLAN